MTDVTRGHTVRSYDEELARLRGAVLEMGELVVEQVSSAAQALCENDAQKGRTVADKDSDVHQFDMAVNEHIEQLFALRQPVATDLRLVLGLSKVVATLARVGDKAKKIALFAVQMDGEETRTPSKRLLRHVRSMNERACCMLDSSLDALAKLDVKAAVEIIREDDELDEEFDAGMRHLVTFMWENPSAVTKVMDMIFVIKALERVGDYANHVAQQVIFIARGRDVRYVNPEYIGD